MKDDDQGVLKMKKQDGIHWH